MKSFLTLIVDRLREKSTWLGMISILTAVGIVLSPEMSDAVIALGMSVGGLLAAVTGSSGK